MVANENVSDAGVPQRGGELKQSEVSRFSQWCRDWTGYVSQVDRS